MSGSLLMVVSDLDLLRTGIGPDEADAKLIVDSNAELPLAVTAQPLQTVARWHREIAPVDLWDNGHFKEAVRSVADAVEEQTRLKIDRSDLTGASIFNEAFSLNPSEPG